MVEFALIMPALFLVGMGLIEFTLAMTDFNALRHGAREGARGAVVADFGGVSACSINGTAPASAATRELVCLTKDRSDLNASRVRVQISWPGQYSPGQPITVCATYPLASVSGVMAPFLGGRSLRTSTEMRIERVDVSLEPFSEALPPGQNWDWCG
jgi:hypothetical protein